MARSTRLPSATHKDAVARQSSDFPTICLFCAIGLLLSLVAMMRGVLIIADSAF